MSLIFQDVYFAFGSRVVFDGLNADITTGSKIALMGVSGSGKTTFLRLAAGLVKPLRGKVYLSGDATAGGAAFVFQENRLVPHLSAVSNVLLTAPASDAAEILRELGLGDELDSLPGSLSGGMARRVALARALAYTDSALLLLDEPFSGLDEATREKTALCILRRAAGRTIIMSTHDEAEVELLGAQALRL